MSSMRPRYWIILFCALTACSQPVPPAPTQVVEQPPAVLGFPALMEAPQNWTGREVIITAPLIGGAGSRILGPGIDTAGSEEAEPIDDPRQTLWLAEQLPDALVADAGDGPVYLKLRGQLSPPGAYGDGARFPYQFLTKSAGLLPPERTTIANLAENGRVLDGAILELTGSLLVSDEGALLVDRVTAGGVPAADGHQVKIADLPQQALEGLQPRGNIHSGLVAIAGWWHNGALVPFLIRHH
jgi:hypothetical protein